MVAHYIARKFFLHILLRFSLELNLLDIVIFHIVIVNMIWKWALLREYVEFA